MQTYLCLKPAEWAGNEYVPGLHYTDYGDEAHKAFGVMARQWCREGIFRAVEGTSPARTAMRARFAGTATVIKKGA